ncbi:MAG: 5'(3')-deoxyribonucleotidase, partial [Chitinophagaceae bacterium]|nr:5'(3')-deoxyribonucleotidase [Chitinophagaceae bacterium]
MERIIIDMDEVMADTMGGMFTWYKERFILPLDYEKMKGSWMLGIPEAHKTMVREQLYSVGFFRHLPVMKDCVEVMEELNKQYEVFIVSAATEFPNSLKDKLEWLEEHFPFLTWRQLVLCGDKRMIAGDYMIDDHVRNLVHFKGKPYLYSTILNKDETGYERLNNWREIA